jgi:2-iminobutanoate/2-iminopropanoate deaminase
MLAEETTMTLKTIKTDQAPAAIGPYSQGIEAAPFVFVSGQLGLNPATGELVGPDLASQARQALDNLQQILKAGGCSLNDVVAVDVFLTNMDNFLELNAIYSDYFSDHKPARAAIEVSALPKGGVVEIKCIACRP